MNKHLYLCHLLVLSSSTSSSETVFFPRIQYRNEMKRWVLNCMAFGAMPWYTVAKELHACKENQRL